MFVHKGLWGENGRATLVKVEAHTWNLKGGIVNKSIERDVEK